MKAQFWSFDVIFAIVIFGVAITIIAFTWYQISTQLSLSYGNGAAIMELQADTLAKSLLSEGYPSDWESLINTTNSSTWKYVSIGILNRTGISIKKLYAFMSMSNSNYQATKQALGIGFDYFIVIESKLYNNGINITIGRNPAKNNALTIYVEKRSSFINGVPVEINIYLWTQTPFGVE
ncbi:MAG: hypothetical protein ACP5TL_00135 [Candidatus Micrarchaeia archaeon]